MRKKGTPTLQLQKYILYTDLQQSYRVVPLGLIVDHRRSGGNSYQCIHHDH
jgi:hypothetical protein